MGVRTFGRVGETHRGCASVLAQVAVWLALLLGLAGSARARACEPGRGPNEGDRKPRCQGRIARLIPMAKLTADGKAKAAWVLSNSGVFRRLPVRVIPCDPDMYLFLVQHPDVVVNIWELLGASHLAVQQTGPDSYKVTDDIGTSGTIEFLYRSHDTHVVYVNGTYRGPLFGQSIRARGVMLLKSGYVQETDGRYYITTRLDAFMHIEPSGVEFLTKTFLPAVGKVADNNFAQTAAFLASVSRTAEVNGRGMRHLASRLSKVQPEVRQQFAQVAEQVAQKAATGDRPVALREEHAGSKPQDAVAVRLAQRPDEAKPLPAANLKTSPLLQSPSDGAVSVLSPPALPSTSPPATPAGTASGPGP